MGAAGTAGQLGAVPAHHGQRRPLTTLPLFRGCMTWGPLAASWLNGPGETQQQGFHVPRLPL